MRAVFENRNLCIDMIGPYLTTKELARLLCTCKRLYSFRPAFFATICDCWQEFGQPRMSNFMEWIEKCMLRDDVAALRFLVVEECADADFKLSNLVYSELLPYVTTKASLRMLCSVCDLYEDVLNYKRKQGCLSFRLVVQCGVLKACDDSMQYLLTRFENMLFEGYGLEFKEALWLDIITHGRKQELLDFVCAKFNADRYFGYDSVAKVVLNLTSTKYVDIVLKQAGVLDRRDEIMRWILFNPNPAMRDYLRFKFQSE